MIVQNKSLLYIYMYAPNQMHIIAFLFLIDQAIFSTHGLYHSKTNKMTRKVNHYVVIGIWSTMVDDINKTFGWEKGRS